MFSDFNTLLSSGFITPDASDLASLQTFKFSVAHSLSQIDFPNLFSINFDQPASSLYLSLTSFPDICHALQFCPISNSDHAVVSVDTCFHSSIRQELPINKTSFCYQYLVWDSLCNFLWNASCEIQHQCFHAILEILNKASIFLVHSCLFSLYSPHESPLLVTLT